MSKVTKAQLQAQLKDLGVAFKAKDNVATLQSLLDAAQKPAPKKRVSSKDILRQLYAANPNAAFTIEELHEHVSQYANVKQSAVETAITDLKNPNWAKGELLVLKRNGEKQYVLEA